MGKLKVYLDTSVISYLDQQDAFEKMIETRKLWELFKKGKYDVYLSSITIQELGRCKKEKYAVLMGFMKEIDYTQIDALEDNIKLAERILDFGILKRKSIIDCQHIAAAILAGCDMIVSWNFKHIVNVKTVRGIKILTTTEGYKDLMIYPPTALLDYEEDE